MSRETSQPRKYEQKKRADDVAHTRRRITEAAIDLHGSLGPSRTTLTAVAQRAGVERRTLYRHFPTEAALFAACSAHYFSDNPWPDLAAWRDIADPRERLERALAELYAYYEHNEPMFSNVLRDAELVDFARDAISPLGAFLEEAAGILMTGRGLRGKRRELASGMLRHVLAFSTWRSLWRNGIGSEQAARAMCTLVEGV
jgi:AcrR family transcriptional regulator